MKSKLFTPVTFGPLTLRNRTIRSAAFESMCPGNAPSQMLLDYHRSVAAGLRLPNGDNPTTFVKGRFPDTYFQKLPNEWSGCEVSKVQK